VEQTASQTALSLFGVSRCSVSPATLAAVFISSDL